MSDEPEHRSLRPIRLACVIHSLNGGGAERVMAGLVSRLAARGHDVTLVTLDNNDADRHAVDDRVKRMSLNVMSTPEHRVGTAKRLIRLRRTLIDGQFEVVLSFCDATNLLVLMATWGASRKPPIVVSERSDPAFQSLGRTKEWLRNRLYRRTTAVVCLSDSVAQTMSKRLSRDVHVIASAVEAAPLPDALVGKPTAKRTSDKSLRLIAVGRLEHEKGFDRLLNSLGSLQTTQSVPDWQLTIFGDGSQLQSLQQQSSRLGIGDRITFAGWVSPLWHQYQHSDLFILPSRYEGFPSAMLEAMASRLAVIAVDAGGGVRESIRNGENGLIVPNTDDALTDGIRELLTNPPLRERLASNAPAISQQFSWDRMVDAYERLLCQCATEIHPSDGSAAIDICMPQSNQPKE